MTYLWLDYESRIWFALIFPKLNIQKISHSQLEIANTKGYVTLIETEDGKYKKIALALRSINDLYHILSCLFPSLYHKQLLSIELRLHTTFIDNPEYVFSRRSEDGLYLNYLESPIPIPELAQYLLEFPMPAARLRRQRVYYALHMD